MSTRAYRATYLARLVETPDLVHRVHELAPPAFAAVVRAIGVEDAGELVALATTEQLVAAFDEDLFDNRRPGEREQFDPQTFATWLEVLIDAGDAIAAARVAELSTDFVVHALHTLIVVLDQEALMLLMSEDDAGGRRADKAIESSLSEELDGYLLLARCHDGWDAVLALVLALDRDHRALLERVLDRCARLDDDLVDDLDALADVMSAEGSLADDIDGEREARRAAAGYVEPRAAASFLALARRTATDARDPITRAALRDLEPHAPTALPAELRDLLAEHAPVRTLALPAAAPAIVDGLGMLAAADPTAYADRMRELAYLANVLVAGASIDRQRVTPGEAARAVLATVQLGLAARGATDAHTITYALRTATADRLFREASSALVARDPRSPGFVVA